MERDRQQVGDWEVCQEIGRGAYATVYRGRNVRSGQEVAVKEINTSRLSKKLKQSLESEVSILRKVKHENIVQLHDVLESNGKMYLIMEFCAGGDLAAYIREHTEGQHQSSYGIPEATAQAFMRQLAAGLHAMWERSLVHRDLKPQNLLLSCEGPAAVLKIADFGFARHLQPQLMAATMCGSPLYMAPEILQQRQYDSKADLWSVGVILYELLVGRPPFNAGNHYHLIRQIQFQEAKIPDGLASSVSEPCVQLMLGLLKKNPFERMSFEEFFNHPFLLPSSSSALSYRAGLAPCQSESSTSSMSSTHSTHMARDRIFGPLAPEVPVSRFPLPSAGVREIPGLSQLPAGEHLAFAVDEWSGPSHGRTGDESSNANTRPPVSRLRPTLVSMPGSRFAHLAGPPLPQFAQGARLTDRATSLPTRLPPPQADEEEEDYVFISREAASSVSSHGSSLRSSSNSLGNSGASTGQGRGHPPRAPPSSHGVSAGGSRVTSGPSALPPPAPVSSGSSQPSLSSFTAPLFPRSQTLPPRMPVPDPAAVAAAFNVASGLSWAAAGGVDRLEGLRQVCHAMESLALGAAPGPAGARAALALRVMSLQVLQVALDESGGPHAPGLHGQHPILNDMRIITGRAEQVVLQIGSNPAGDLPDVWELVYRGALGLAQDAGAKECLGDFGSSRKLYTRAGALLYFMLAEAPNLKLVPSLDLRADERLRLHHYTTQIRLRHACCTAIIEAASSANAPMTAAVGAAISAASTPRPSLSPT